jgi:hypothetical protein
MQDWTNREREVAMTMQRNFLLSVTLAAAFATPAWGQTVTPAVEPVARAAQSAASLPDFSGIWAYPFCCGFQGSLSGPGPVANISRRNGASSRYQYVGDYTNPILKPHAAEIVKKHGEIEATGVPLPTPRNHCWPEGVPFIFSNFGIQILQQPDKLTILYDHDHQVRRVRLNARHPAQLIPSWYGDSVGHYDGDTLVIDTAGIKIGPYSMIDWYGTPYTEALHVVERYRFIDDEAAKEAEERGAKVVAPVATGGGLAPNLYYNKGDKALQLEFTVEDDGVFTMPWSASITRRRSLSVWTEFVCAENPHGYFVGKNAAIPTADKPDF